MKVILMLSVW